MRRLLVSAAALVVIAGVSVWVATGAASNGRAARPSPAPSEAVLGIVAAASASPAQPTAETPTDTPSPSPTATPTASPTPTPPPTPAPAATVRAVVKPAPTAPPLARVAPRAGAVRFVALGDSLTAWPAGDPWPSRLAAEDSSILLVHNAGVPGNVTSQMLARFSYDVARYSPGLLVVMGGTNDIGHGIAQSVTIANLRAIVEAGKARGMTVVLLTIPPNSFSGEVAAVRSLNAAIRSLAWSEGAGLIDIYSPLASPSGLYRARYTVDGLHFSNVAAQIVANTVRAGLSTLGF